MLRRTFAIGGTLLVSAALVFLTPSASQARGGGHGGGGFHGGSFHGGGFHAGGYHYGGYHYGGYHYGGYHYRPNYGGYHYGGYHYRPYYGGYYGYYPYYYNNYPYYGSYPYYSTSTPSSGSVYDPGYSSSSYQPAPSSTDGVTAGGSTLGSDQPSSAFTSPGQGDTSAHLTVTVPADAEIWFEGTAMTSTGPVREFTSPPLTPGKKYTYDVRARWNENGHEVTQTQQVEVTAGGLANVFFPVPPKTAAQTSAGPRS